MDYNEHELNTAGARIEEKYGMESKTCFVKLVSNALLSEPQLTYDEVLYVAELLIRGTK